MAPLHLAVASIANLGRCLAIAAMIGLVAVPEAFAAGPVQAECTLRDFRFHTGEVLPTLRLNYTTLGERTGVPVLVLHGTAGTGTGMLTPGFGGVLFGPGQPLDAAKHFIILPDSLGAGQSAKPSDGMRAAFPRYDYTDMVQAQYLLVTECLSVKHLRLVLGNSMGGMHAWLWGTTYPGFVDALVPMAAQPSAMAGRNWMMRRALIESIRQDPAYQGGAYTVQPSSLRLANTLFGIGTNGGTLAWQAQAPTTARADQVIDTLLAAPAPADANDFIWQWDSSRTYDASPGLERITARVLAINAEDDERNPPQTGLMARGMARLRHGELLIIPASAETRGHGTTSLARFWADRLRAFMAGVP